MPSPSSPTCCVNLNCICVLKNIKVKWSFYLCDLTLLTSSKPSLFKMNNIKYFTDIFSFYHPILPKISEFSDLTSFQSSVKRTLL